MLFILDSTGCQSFNVGGGTRGLGKPPEIYLTLLADNVNKLSCPVVSDFKYVLQRSPNLEHNYLNVLFEF